MATDFKSIPIIDIGPLLSKSDDPDMGSDPGVAQVVEQLDLACREAGFFYVKGHGVPDPLVKEVRSIARKFFHLPYEEKLKIKMTPEAGYRGYQRLGENITKGVPDLHEAIDCYTEIKPGRYGALGKPMEGPNQCLRNLMLTELSRKIMRGIGLALGGSPSEFEGDRAGEAFWVTRIIGYPGVPDANGDNKTDNDVGWYLVINSAICGCLIGLLTLVNQDDDITALQVKNLSGEWISAPPIPGTFVCNIGDMLKIWSNSLYESTLHRVVNNNAKYRVCVAYFYEPNYDAIVEPLDFCIQKSGGVRKLGKSVYGEHLVSKVQTNFA
ncbi:unnamed protein product [Linum tenue]|uniref:Fe2OG dioxygenase domain-containing protein n=1 Tax=Linum tenue TaxID=586396 RepID=A0AAV0JB50_9ROSI|nr:unnamed protein product [Linum tenue]